MTRVGKSVVNGFAALTCVLVFALFVQSDSWLAVSNLLRFIATTPRVWAIGGAIFAVSFAWKFLSLS
jgi:hypothetical protein